jgi:ribosomal protein L7Ae-like RNA K-turn-binding protein
MNKPIDQKVLNALGLCAKARRLITGTPMVCESLRGAKKPFLVLCAADNSENTAKKLKDKTAFYGVPLVTLSASGAILANAVGKRGGQVAAVAITDENFCRLITASLEQDRPKQTDTQ